MKDNTRSSRMKEPSVERLRAAIKEASKKRHVTHHNFAVLRKSRGRKAFGEISNHEVRAKRYELHDASSIELATMLDPHINVAGRFPAHRINRHGNASQMILIDISRGKLR